MNISDESLQGNNSNEIHCHLYQSPKIISYASSVAAWIVLTGNGFLKLWECLNFCVVCYLL